MHTVPKEAQEFQQAAIQFARKALCRDDMIERDRRGTFDREGFQSCADFGLLGMPIPEAYGGTDVGLTSLIAAMEGLGYVCQDQGLLFSVNAHLWTNSIPILRYGTEEQKKRWLPGLTNGTHVGANGVSEPGAGSDVFAMQSRAERRDQSYVLNGRKTFVTNAPVADVFVVYATINPEYGALGVSAFVLDRDTPGLMICAATEKMGLRTSPMSDIVFENCVIPDSQRLGREGRGGAVFECSMEWERGCILASCLGAMRRLLEASVEHAQTRKQFGKPIGKFQSVANRIVDMRVRLDMCRPLVYRIGALKDAGEEAQTEAAVAKLAVADAYVASCRDAMQVFGGAGYLVEQEIERELRNAMGSPIYSGTSDIQRNIIARGMGL